MHSTEPLVMKIIGYLYQLTYHLATRKNILSYQDSIILKQELVVMFFNNFPYIQRQSTTFIGSLKMIHSCRKETIIYKLKIQAKNSNVRILLQNFGIVIINFIRFPLYSKFILLWLFSTPIMQFCVWFFFSWKYKVYHLI